MSNVLTFPQSPPLSREQVEAELDAMLEQVRKAQAVFDRCEADLLALRMKLWEQDK